MGILRHIAVAFSMYSKIPMPRFEWKEDDMSSSLAFFPLVGVVIGAFTFALNALWPLKELPVAVRIFLSLLIPFMITGGFHADGFMDTEDALNSYADAGRKLEIMKDPHTGAFAVISLVKWLLAWGASITAVLMSKSCTKEILLIPAAFYVISRSLSGLCSIHLKKAKKSGMLYEETKKGNRILTASLLVWMIPAAVLMIFASAVCGTAVLLWSVIYTLYYRHKAYEEFGGVTGDTAGFYLTTLEISSWAVLAVSLYVFV